jgi:NitT/TauT family transport system substrate-binding protein
MNFRRILGPLPDRTSWKSSGYSCPQVRSRSAKSGGRRLGRAILAAGTLAMLAAGCAQVEPAPSSGADLNIKVGVFPGLWQEVPIYVAQEKGFFAANGLAAELITSQTGPVMVAAAASGSLDAFSFTANGTMVTNSKGYGFRQIASVKPEPIYGVLGLKQVMEDCPHAGRPYPEPILCMKGKKVAVSALGSDNYNVALTLLKDAGLTEKDVSILPVGGNPALITALQHGQADFTIPSQPGEAQLVDVSKIATSVVYLSESNQFFKDWPGQGVFALERSLKESPEKYQRLIASLDDAIKWAVDPQNALELSKIFVKYSPATDSATALALAKETASSFDIRVRCSSIENASAWLVDTQQIHSEARSECKDFVWDYTIERFPGNK